MPTATWVRFRRVADFAITGIVFGAVGVSSARAEEAVILTPKPPETPRINGAKVFGVRPGHPFLFTIPATGRRPMEFAVDNLPEGLKVDGRSGQITGSIKNRGTYVVTFRAKNALGEAQRKFKIVCGDTLALTPPMGWNSWYIWGGRRDRQDHARRRRRDGLDRHDRPRLPVREHRRLLDGQAGIEGSDAGRPARDAQGNINPNQRFPDMKSLTGYIHGKGSEGGDVHVARPVDAAAARASMATKSKTPGDLPNGDSTFSSTTGARIGSVPESDLAAQCRNPIARWATFSSGSTGTSSSISCQYGMGNVCRVGRDVGRPKLADRGGFGRRL